MENYTEVKYKGELGEFRKKKCTKCNLEYEATFENFSFRRGGRVKLDSWCRSCKVKQDSKRSRNRVKEGILCRCCSNFKLPNTQLCTYHTVYYVLSNQIKIGRFKHIKTKEQKRELVEQLIEKLALQDYKCAITGIPIELGKNAQLDHIVEICNKGTCELNNLQWVDSRANQTKPTKYKEQL